MRGNDVYGTAKVVKFSGYHATQLVLSAKGQRYYNGGWHTVSNEGSWTKNVNTSSRATLKHAVSFTPSQTGKARILVSAKIWDGSQLIGSGKQASPACP